MAIRGMLNPAVHWHHTGLVQTFDLPWGAKRLPIIGFFALVAVTDFLRE
jgi:hypothetical protein